MVSPVKVVIGENLRVEQFLEFAGKVLTGNFMGRKISEEL